MFFVLAASLVVCSCKKEMKNDYVEMVQGKWVVAYVTPEVPINAYVAVGDKIEIKSDLSYTIDNNWNSYFEDKMWAMSFDTQTMETWLHLFGTNPEEKRYVLLAGRVMGFTQDNMYLEYVNEWGDRYRYNFQRIGNGEQE